MFQRPLSDLRDEDLVDRVGQELLNNPGESQRAQAELTKRLIESIQEFNKATTDYSNRLLKLTFVLFAVAIFQLVTSVFSIQFGSLWINFVAALSVAVTMFFVVRMVLEDNNS